MERSFDFGRLLKDNVKKHKSKPAQFVSVSGGVKKRLESGIKSRKSTRLTVFDSVRDLNTYDERTSKCPAPSSEAQLKVEHRRQQLEKWKMEKEQKKKEIAAQKKKPFLTGVARAPLKFEPPPPVLPKPSSSGRVTRSQTKNLARSKPKSPVKKPSSKQIASQKISSFAPKNATFNPPKLKNIPTLSLSAPTQSKKTVSITFAPIIPSNKTKFGKSKPAPNRKNVTEDIKPKLPARTTRSRVAKKPEKLPSQSSSSGNDAEAKKPIMRIKTPYSQQTDSKKALNGTKELIVRLINLHSTTDSSSSDCSNVVMKQKPRMSMKFHSNSDSDDVVISSESDVSPVLKSKGRKSIMPNTGTNVVSSSSDETTSLIVSQPLTPKDKSVPKSESSSEEKLRSPKQVVDLPLTPTQMESAIMNPGVTVSRGKDNARKEMKWKIDEGYLDDTMHEEDGVEHFRMQLSFETTRLTELCDSWDNFSKQNVLPDQVQECILAAVGQGRLLMSQKMQQFATLMKRSGHDDGLITLEDLHGFWDMVYLQVKNVDMRFKKLEEMRSRNWTEDVAVKASKKAAKPAAKKAVKPVGQSRIKEMIAAARAAAKKQEGPAAEPSPSKTFDAGFFSVSSPVREPSPRVHTPINRGSLLKAVLSSEAKKASFKNVTPFAVLRATLAAKDVDWDGVEPLPQTPQLTPINLFATPARSILKSTNTETKSGKKSVKTVLFNSIECGVLNQSFSSEITSDYYETANETKDKDIVQDKENIQDRSSSEVSTVRTRRQKKLAELTNNNNIEEVEVKTPRRSSRIKVTDDSKAEADSATDSANKSVKRVGNRRASRQKALQDIEVNVLSEVDNIKRSSRRSQVDKAEADSAKDSAKKSVERVGNRRLTRQNALQDNEANDLSEVVNTKRSSRRSQVANS